jgi:hypothetical protein
MFICSRVLSILGNKMSKRKVVAALACLCFGTVSADTLVFTESGFSINSLENEQSAKGSTPIQMLLPPANGFSPNVNVQLQPYKGSVAEYRAITEGQFKQNNLTLISLEESDDGQSLSIEYKGTLQGQNLHWYAKSFKKGDVMYLVTATNSEANWEQYKEQLIANVESFILL